jgi:hypothetical protein
VFCETAFRAKPAALQGQSTGRLFPVGILVRAILWRTDRRRKREENLQPHIILETHLIAGARDMPSDWIRSKAEHEIKEQAKQTAFEEKQKRDAELIRALGPKLVEELRKVIHADIVAWNENFTDRQINGTSYIPNGFSVDKVGFPRGSADIKFNPVTLRIEIGLTRSVLTDFGESYHMDGYVHVRANPDGRGVHMEERFRNSYLEPAGFSRMILESIAEPQSNHMF